ncbi:MAG: hypothetical protein WB586_05540 [Chthoniobacterales bacterium]
MNAHKKLLVSGLAALTVLFSGCAGEYLAGPYEGPYYGDFGPYYSGYGPSYGGDFVIGGAHYPNHFGGHHFYGQSFGARHFAVAHGPEGIPAGGRAAAPGGHAHGGGGHR